MLSTPPAFVLSQDQTLQFYILNTFSSVHSLLTYFFKSSVRLLFSFQRPAFNSCPPFRAEGEDNKSSSRSQTFLSLFVSFRSTAAIISPSEDRHNRCGLYGRSRLAVKSFFLFFKQSAPRVWTQGALLNKFRRRPTFPHSFPCSIISAVGLNFCVRDGNRCDPYAIATEKL